MYDASSDCLHDYEKGIWSSHESMMNRLELSSRAVDWSKVGRWLDIGCGPGNFFSFMSRRMSFDLMVGCDISYKMLRHAKNKNDAPNCFMIQGDAETLPFSGMRFDLVTMVGVLQASGAAAGRVIADCARCLHHGGQLLITTKNIEWSAFTSGRLVPDTDIEWFRPGDIEACFMANGITPKTVKGILPNENRFVETADSHSILLAGEKT